MALVLYGVGLVWRWPCMALVLYGVGLVWRWSCMAVVFDGGFFSVALVFFGFGT